MLNSDAARFVTLIKPVLQQIRLLAGFNVVGKKRTKPIAFQLVLRQCCKDNLLVFVARLIEAYTVSAVKFF